MCPNWAVSPCTALVDIAERDVILVIQPMNTMYFTAIVDTLVISGASYRNLKIYLDIPSSYTLH